MLDIAGAVTYRMKQPRNPNDVGEDSRVPVSPERQQLFAAVSQLYCELVAKIRQKLLGFLIKRYDIRLSGRESSLVGKACLNTSEVNSLASGKPHGLEKPAPRMKHRLVIAMF